MWLCYRHNAWAHCLLGAALHANTINREWWQNIARVMPLVDPSARLQHANMPNKDSVAVASVDATKKPA